VVLVLELDLKKWQPKNTNSLWALNLDSVFYASRAASSFQKRWKCSIINYTSNAAWNGAGPGAGIMQFLKEEYNQSLER
jgi:NAD(P)-dependent dehydrogenase (short-subunit alcohol dehydrogenase family)